MIYYVKPKEQKTIVSLMQVLLGIEQQSSSVPNTTTVRKESEWYGYNYSSFNLTEFVSALKLFNSSVEPLRTVDRWELYNHFKIPKKSGGLRPIDAPNEQLKAALTTLKALIETHIGEYFHHPCAFAYIRKRSTKTCVEVHQKAESRWFAHFDFSNFFGSTTMDFVLRMCKIIYPLNIVMKNAEACEEFSKAIELCFLNGGLPQGTPMSPFLTNIMMIPIDHELLAMCGSSSPHLVYTRYADDIFISSKYDFDCRKLESRINEILHIFEAPFRINPEKTHYGSSSGRNWMLGLMLNKDNKITIGHENKKRFKAMLSNYIVSVKNGTLWDLDDVYSFNGNISYYRSVEREYIDHIIQQYNTKYGVDVENLIKSQINGTLVA